VRRLSTPTPHFRTTEAREVILGEQTYLAILLRRESGAQCFVAYHEGDFMHEGLRIAGAGAGRAQLRELGLEAWVRGDVGVCGEVVGRHG
jgi:hypothetical protein